LLLCGSFAEFAPLLGGFGLPFTSTGGVIICFQVCTACCPGGWKYALKLLGFLEEELASLLNSVLLPAGFVVRTGALCLG